MKNQLLFAVLAALAIFASGSVIDPKEEAGDVLLEDVIVPEVIDAVEEAGTGRSERLSVGWIDSKDRLLYRNQYFRSAWPGVIQVQDISFRASGNTRIYFIRAVEVGFPQGARASIIGGGISQNHVNLRITTLAGHGFHMQVEYWGS